MPVYLDIQPQDRLGATRGSAANCVVARAGQRTWGGQWEAVPGQASQRAGGSTKSWRLGLGTTAAMFAYDKLHLPFPARRVKLIKRGPGRALKRAAVPVGAGAAWVAVSAGLGSLVLVLVYGAVAVAGYLVLGAFGAVPVPRRGVATAVGEPRRARRPGERERSGGEPVASKSHSEIPDGLRVPLVWQSPARAERAREAPAPEPAQAR